MKSLLLNLCVTLLACTSCGGDKIGSVQPVKPVCATYKDCWAYGETPEGCCVDPHNSYAWICTNPQTDKHHCGDCDTSCAGECVAGLCQ